MHKHRRKGRDSFSFAGLQNEEPVTEELDNGAKIIGLEHGGIDTAIAVAFPWGLRHNQYIPHALEHIVFRQRRHSRASAADTRIEELGGFYTGYTGIDKLVFLVRVLHQNLEQTLEVVRESILNPQITDRTLRKEKRIIEGELQERLSDPLYYMWVIRDRIILGENHPLYHYPETISGIRALTAEEIRTEKQRYLGARNMQIGLVGPEIRQSVGIAKKIMESLPKKGRKIEKFEIPDIKREIRTSRRIGFHDCVLSVTSAVPGYNNQERFAVEIIANLLAATVNEYESRARLWSRIRDREGMMYHTGVEHEIYPDAGLLEISVKGILPRHLKNVRPIIESEFERLCRYPVGDRQLDGARDSLILNEARSIEPLEDTAEKLVELSMGGENPSCKTYIRGLRNVTPLDILSVARKYFSPDKLFIGTVRPA